jgi:hypothetical protein
MYVGLRQSQRKWQEPSKNDRPAETEMNKLSPRQRAEALKRLSGGTIHLPKRMKDQPDRDRLALRFERFKAAA